MKIATYNIHDGGRQRVHWLKLIKDHSVDLLLVQESCHPDEHLSPLLYPDFQKQFVWKAVAHDRWGSGLFSRSGSLKYVVVPGFDGWVIGAEISGAAWRSDGVDSLLAFSIHAPTGAGEYAKQVNKILDEIGTIADGRQIVIGGDFNLEVNSLSSLERPLTKQELAIQARLSEYFGLLNCWQAMHPNQPPHQTLRWNGNRSAAHHCDGLFVPKTWQDRLVACDVLAGDEWNDLSDHNPVIAGFQ